MRNGRLYARQPFKKDEIIEIARVLLLPEESIIGAGPIDQYVWWKEVNDNLTDILVPPMQQVCGSKDGSICSEKDEMSEYIPISGRFVALSLGLGVFNQQSKKGENNVKISWWDGHIKNRNNSIMVPTSNETKIIEEPIILQYGDIESLLQSKKNVPPGLEATGCSGRMFVEFKAMRDIDIGEELSVDLIIDPVTGFRYLGDREFSKFCL